MGNYASNSGSPLFPNNYTFPFISEAFDDFFSSFGYPYFQITLAITAIVLGLLIAFLGPKGPAVVAFVAGFLVGCFASGIMLETFDNDMDRQFWIPIFFLCGILVGLICACVIAIVPVILGLSLGIFATGIMLQTGLGSAIGNNYIILGLVAICCIIGIIVACKILDLIYIIVSAVLGGVFVIIGIAYFTKSEITLYGLVSNPAVVAKCDEMGCIVPLAVGIILAFVAVAYNFNVLRKSHTNQRRKSSDMLGFLL